MIPDEQEEQSPDAFVDYLDKRIEANERDRHDWDVEVNKAIIKRNNAEDRKSMLQGVKQQYLLTRKS